MFKLAVLAIVLISAQATAEVCVENDTNLPEGSLSYGFIPGETLKLTNGSHPILTPPPNFQLKHLEKGDANCIEFFESEEKGTPGRLVVYIKPKTSSKQAYSNEDIVYISKRAASAPSSSTQMLSIQNGAANAPFVKAIQNDPGDDVLVGFSFTLDKVFIPSDK